MKDPHLSRTSPPHIMTASLRQAVTNLGLRLLLLLSFLLPAIPLLPAPAEAISARVTISTYANFASQNPPPGHLTFMRSSFPNAGNDYEEAVAWADISGNVTNQVVNLGSTAGYFTVVFNNNNYSQASQCTTSPVDYYTSSSYLSGSGSFDFTINCTVPDSSGPVQQSANVNTTGTTLTIVFNESIDSMSTPETSDYTVTADGTGVAVTGVSFSGSSAILTLASPIAQGKTVLVSYSGEDNWDIVDDSFNQAANFTNFPVTNNSTVGAVSTPTVTAVSPSSGPTAGGTSVTITGTNLTGASAVKFGGTNASGYTVNSATQITATAPAGSAGTVDITVTTAGGTSATGASDRYTYMAAPTVTGVSPATGSTAGGTSVTITGTNFTGATAVKFGSNAASFTVNSATQITATSPAGSAGNVDITVTTAGGTSATGASDRFTYATAPSAVTGAASGIGAAGATLNGTVNDNGAATTVTFDYGLTTGYGTSIAADTGASIAAGAGSSAVAKTMGGLSCNSTYHFRVSTQNSVGTTNGSDASFTTSPCVPGAPTIGTATAGDTQVSVSFSAPGSDGGSAITGYTVTATPGGATGTGLSSPITVTGLANGTSYTFTVTATNAVGTGSASSASNGVTAKANQTITFADPGGQSFGTAPALSATATSGLTPTFSSSTPGVCTVTSVGALTFLSTGTCTVAADQAGDGTHEAALQVSRSFTVNAVVPGAPTIGTATAGDAQASVSFSAPAFDGGAAITGYTVTATPGGTTGTGLSSPITVTGLANGTSYSFTVTATNAAGTGSASSASNGVTAKANQTITFADPGGQSFGTAPALSATATSGLTPTFSSSTPGVCTVTSVGALTFLSTGTCTVAADQAGNGFFNPAATVSVSFSVIKGNQAIDFAQPTAVSYGNSPLTLSDFVTPGPSGNPVTFSVIGGTGSGTLSGSNNATLSIASAGTIVIEADQAGDAYFNAATPVQRTLTVNKATLSIGANARSKPYGGPDPALAYSVSGLVNGDNSAVITGTLSRTPGETVAGGPYAIGQGTLGAGGNYTISFTGANLTITKANPVITWPTPFPAPAGTPLDIRQLNASADVPGSFVYSPPAGTVLSAGSGQTLSVDFTPTDSSNYDLATRSVTMEVQKQAQSISFAPLPVKLLTDAPFALSATAESALPVGYSSSNPAVATVSGSTITVVGVGTTTISASQGGDATYAAAASVNQPLVVAYSATGPTLSVSTLADGSVTGNATLNVSGSASSVNGISSILMNGTPVTLGAGASFSYALTLEEGATDITVTAIDRAGLEDSETRTVVLDTTAPAITVVSPADNASLNSVWITVTGSIDSAGTVEATVNGGSPQAATLTGSEFSVALSLQPGSNTVQITATDLHGNDSSVSRTLFSDPTAPSLQVTAPGQDISTDQSSITLQGTIFDNLTLVQVTVSVDGQEYTPTVVAGSFQQSITLPLAKQYAIVVTATDLLGNQVFVQRNVIRRGTPTVTWSTPAAIVYGTPLSATQLSATAAVPGSFSYTPAAGTVLGAGSHTLSVTFTPDDGDTYAPVTASVAIEINRAAPVITWNAPVAIVYGTPLSETQLNARAAVAGSFSYAPAPGTIPGAGPAQNLTVTFTPDDSANYAPVSRSVAIDVTQATPSVTWSNPATIVHGTPLSATQLNATASVPGSFVYTPPAGTVVGAGAGQTLSVLFVPSDPANYRTATGSVAIDVDKAAPAVSWSTPATIVYGTALSSLQLNATADVSGSFSYTPAAGAVLAAGTQTLSVTFTPTDTADYGTVTRNVTIVVDKATPVLAWQTPAPIGYGAPLSSSQLNATASVQGSFVYTPAVVTVLTAGSHTLSVVFTPSDAANFTGASASVALEVVKKPQSITFTQPSGRLIGDAPFELDATADSGLSVSYGSSDPSVATISGSTVTVVGAGTTTITASQGGNANYAAAPEVNRPLVVGYNALAPRLDLSALPDGSITAVATLNLTGSATSENGIRSVLMNGTAVALDANNGFSLPLVLTEGRNSLVTTVLDNAGLEITDRREIILDTAAPAITVSTPADNSSIAATHVTVKGYLDNPGTVSATVDGGSPQAASMNGNNFSVDLNLRDGSNTVLINATDLAGNGSTAKRTLVSDTTIPALAVTAPAADTTVNATTLLIAGTVSDDLGAPSVTVTMDGTSYTPNVADGAFQQRLELPTPKSYSITVRAVDQVGNTTSVQRNVIRARMAGDLTRDGAVDIADALKALQMAVGFLTAGEDDLAVGDVAPFTGGLSKPDGVIDIEDALAILNKAIGLINF